jgi:hypothetical protein
MPPVRRGFSKHLLRSLFMYAGRQFVVVGITLLALIAAQQAVFSLFSTH